MNDTYPYAEYLEHYGVKGMRWGVRKDVISSYKYKQRKLINKNYGRALKTANKLAKIYPDDKSIKREIKDLTIAQNRDLDRISKMTYYDVMTAKKEEAELAKIKRDKVVQDIQRNALWAGRMGLLGVRAYGTFKTVEILGTAGAEAVRYLQSDAGRVVVNATVKGIANYIGLGDKFVQAFSGMDVSADAVVNAVKSEAKSAAKEAAIAAATEVASSVPRKVR